MMAMMITMLEEEETWVEKEKKEVKAKMEGKEGNEEKKQKGRGEGQLKCFLYIFM